MEYIFAFVVVSGLTIAMLVNQHRNPVLKVNELDLEAYSKETDYINM